VNHDGVHIGPGGEKDTMTGKTQFCPRCGSPRSPGATFCGSCGFRFMEQDAGVTARKVQETVRSAESAVRMAESAARTVGGVRDLVITPPAEWRVVVGDRLPEALAARAAASVESKITGIVVDKATSALEKAVAGQGTDVAPGREETRQFPGERPPPSEVRCPSCGAVSRPGAKFCGSCGAALSPPRAGPPAATCPSCGAPLRPGAKFCGSCGTRVFPPDGG
jgi:uncharacterized Zn finger protein (UPF0148 family)